MDSKELQTFIQDVRDDLKNLEGLINYYDFLGHHNIRSIVFNPENDSSFFEGTVVAILDQRYCEFFRSKFNCEIDELTRVDVLEIIRAHLPYIRKKLDE
uniref:Uncharacterized protein n=1 Tax=uncultured marine thaumarchaeote KM3_103_A05 TaxID=1455980 RepID=A0A075GAQ3_9ARCH|nr:hypothetical protein [uncultured marine thaumarchaeote KM3_103_A05]